MIQKTKSHEHDHSHKCHHDHINEYSHDNKNDVKLHVNENIEFQLNHENIYVPNNYFQKPTVHPLGTNNELKEIKSKSPLHNYCKHNFGINKEILEEEFTEDECRISSKNDKNVINNYPSFRKNQDSQPDPQKIENCQKILPDFEMKNIGQKHSKISKFTSHPETVSYFHKCNSENINYEDTQENKIKSSCLQKNTQYKSRTINIKVCQREVKKNNLIDNCDFSPINTTRKSQRSSQNSNKIQFFLLIPTFSNSKTF